MRSLAFSLAVVVLGLTAAPASSADLTVYPRGHHYGSYYRWGPVYVWSGEYYWPKVLGPRSPRQYALLYGTGCRSVYIRYAGADGVPQPTAHVVCR